MKAKLKICLLSVCCIMLTCCSEKDTSSDISSANDSKPSETTAVTDTQSAAKSSFLPKRQIIKVIAKSFDGENLIFEYNGSEYSLPMRAENFIEDKKYPTIHTVGYISEMIINNRIGETVVAELEVTESLDRLFSCDVVGHNGEPFDSNMDIPKGKSYDESAMFTAKREQGSIYILRNAKRSLTFDMNSLPSIYKCDIPENEQLSFAGYIFKDNRLIVEDMSVMEMEGNEISFTMLTNKDKYSFFGTVKSLSDDRVSVLLTDGKTVCDLPTYYTDGELKEGMEVMVTLNAETDLFGSGKEYKDCFAVFHTDPEEYNTSGCEFSELAFARYVDVMTYEYSYARAGE